MQLTYGKLRNRLKSMLTAYGNYVRDCRAGDWGCAEGELKEAERVRDEILHAKLFEHHRLSDLNVKISKITEPIPEDQEPPSRETLNQIYANIRLIVHKAVNGEEKKPKKKRKVQKTEDLS
jgi:hypothetical protein